MSGRILVEDRRRERLQREKARLYALLMLGTLGLCPLCGEDLGGHVCAASVRRRKESA